MLNQQLAELHKQIIGKFEKQKQYSCFKNVIWGTDLADRQLIRRFDRGILFYYMQLIFIISMHGLFLWTTKKVVQLMSFRKFSNLTFAKLSYEMI